MKKSYNYCHHYNKNRSTKKVQVEMAFKILKKTVQADNLINLIIKIVILDMEIEGDKNSIDCPYLECIGSY